MNNLVYKMVKTYGGFNPSIVNYLCKDNYVHVRLRRFGDKPQHLRGFEDKLTFLLTVIMQDKVNEFLELSKVSLAEDKKNYQEIWKQCLEGLKTSKEYKDIECVLSSALENYKGIKILPMYSLKNKPKNAFDLIGRCDNLSSTSMNFILDCDFKYEFMDIVEFLFDNNLEIYIEKPSRVDDSKFINKYKERDLGINLWED